VIGGEAGFRGQSLDRPPRGKPGSTSAISAARQAVLTAVTAIARALTLATCA